MFGHIYKISASQGENVSIKDKELLVKKLQELGILEQTLEVDRFKLQKLVKEGKIDLSKLD